MAAVPMEETINWLTISLGQIAKFDLWPERERATRCSLIGTYEMLHRSTRVYCHPERFINTVIGAHKSDAQRVSTYRVGRLSILAFGKRVDLILNLTPRMSFILNRRLMSHISPCDMRECQIGGGARESGAGGKKWLRINEYLDDRVF